MEISYKNKKLEKQLTDPREIVKSFGELARKINQRLKELKDADSLSILKQIPAARCHEPPPQKDDGGLNWEAVTKIQINEIEDYH